MLPEELLLNRRSDGLADYLNARIYVADNPTSEEIAAAANIAARLAFAVISIDLPVGFTFSNYRNSESTVAVIVGSAALPFVEHGHQSNLLFKDGPRLVLAIPDVKEADHFARSLGSDWVDARARKEYASTTSRKISLSTIFSSDGALSESEGNHFPEMDGTVIALSPNLHNIEVIDLAARIAHEAASIRLPMVLANFTAQRLPNSIAVGYSLSNRLGLAAGEGRIELSDGIPDDPSIVIEGPDDEGLGQALKHAAERLPFVWDHGKNCLQLSKIETDLRYFFERRSPAGQAAAALCKARLAASRLTPEEMKSASLEILIDGDCRPCLNYIASQFPRLHVFAENLNVQSGPLIFEDSFSMPWEGEDARRRIREHLIPKIRPGSRVELSLRLSESPQVREMLANEIRNSLLAAEASLPDLKIQVLSAHKQAYTWIDEVLKPRLAKAERIRIFFSGTTGGNTLIEDENRWLHELYPIDEILSRDLGIPVENVTFVRAAADANAIYEIVGEDKDGHVFLRETFEPKFVVRPMFNAFPEYANVRVGTGWLSASIDGAVIVDERIETDMERFWNNYQSSTLPKIRDYILKLYDGQPSPKFAPHFGVLEVEVTLSEPDYRVGIGEERISTLEALHEDVYFETLLFMELLGLNNPGRIIPRIRRSADCMQGSARIRFTGKTGPNPRVLLKWNNREGSPCQYSENLLPISNGSPVVKSVVVRNGQTSVVLEISGVATTEENLALLSTIREFHEHGVEPTWLSYENVKRLHLGPVEIPQAPEYFRQPQIVPLPATSESMVQWETPIDPVECEDILRKLAAFPEVRPYHAGASYLGRNIWALDVVAPSKGNSLLRRKLRSRNLFFL
jgi:hypothetical protein